MEKLSLLQWLREVDTNKSPPSRYKKGETLVAVKTVSPFKYTFFFQDLIVNVPHRDIVKFRVDDFDELPENLRYFVSAIKFRGTLLENSGAIRNRFEMEGHRTWYIDTLVQHVQSLTDFHLLWTKKVISTQPSISDRPANLQLDTKQRTVVNCLRLICRIIEMNTMYRLNVLTKKKTVIEMDQMMSH
jgi:hypothetical protein